MSVPTPGSPADEKRRHPFQDPALPAEKRIDDLLSLMTLEEKIGCFSTNPSIPRLGVRASGHVEGLHGLAVGGPGEWGKEHPIATTTFPQAIGLAETWDPELVRQVAEIESQEARHLFHSPKYQRAGLVIRAPNADLGRDPRWGRTEECYGEDPFLNGTMAAAFVRGLQGDHPTYWRAAALLKHFLANSNEDERETSSSDFDARLWREYYSVPFRMAIQEGGSRAFMAAYNAHNGVPCTTHPMLRDIAIEEWGQDGIICTDGGAFRLLVTAHRAYPDLAEAAAACLRAGITQFLDKFREGLAEALERGLLSEADLDRGLRGNFRVMLRLGLLDPPELVPYAKVDPAAPDPWDLPAHRQWVRTVTQRSVVLLKNAGGLLPLDRDRLDSVAVIGPLADRVLVDWYSGTLPYAVSPIEGIRAAIRPETKLYSTSNNDISDAIRVARLAQVAIVCVGNHPTGDGPWAQVTRPSYGKEAVDRQTLDLEDERWVRKVREANPATVLVLISSFPYAINWSQTHVPAIVHLTHNSQELGNALADVLFGDVNPAGRLVQTWPRSDEQLPPMRDYDLRRGRTHLYCDDSALYEFGFGLSYTDFEYSELRTDREAMAADGTIRVSVAVTNTGDRAGDEVVQMYARYVRSAVARPTKQLVGFRRIRIEPDQTGTVELPLAARQLAYWDPGTAGFVVEPGEVEIVIGCSSSRIRTSGVVRIDA